MEKHEGPIGVIAAALTPLTVDLAPDLARVCDHCTWLLAHGCDGINLLGTTGEAMSLSLAERLRVMEAVAVDAQPLERFLVGTGASALREAVTLSAAAARLGFCGALVMPPFYYKNLSDDALFGFYAELIERVADSRLRVYLYHFPTISAVPISVPVIERLITSYPGTAVGLKDSSGAPGFAADIAQRFPGFAVYPSSECLLAEAQQKGYSGCISATVNVTAPAAALVWRAVLERRDDVSTQRDLCELRNTIAHYPLIPALRHLADRLRNDGPWVRPLPPLLPLPSAQGAALDAALDRLPIYRRIAAACAVSGSAYVGSHNP